MCLPSSINLLISLGGGKGIGEIQALRLEKNGQLLSKQVTDIETCKINQKLTY